MSGQDCGWGCDLDAEKPNKFGFLNAREQIVLRQMSEQKDMSEEAVMRLALRMYQLVDMHLLAGSQIIFRKPDGTLVDPLNVVLKATL